MELFHIIWVTTTGSSPKHWIHTSVLNLFGNRPKSAQKSAQTSAQTSAESSEKGLRGESPSKIKGPPPKPPPKLPPKAKVSPPKLPPKKKGAPPKLPPKLPPKPHTELFTVKIAVFVTTRPPGEGPIKDPGGGCGH